MDLSEWALWASTIAAAVAAGAAAWQLFLLRRQQGELLALERSGVAVTWHALTPPNDGRDDVWIYTFEAANPGRFPISDVEVVVTFPVAVRRLRHSGVLDAPSTVIQVGTPVLLGGNAYAWKRTLQISPNPEDELRQVYAEVSFVTGDGVRLTNRWPRTLRSR